MFQPDATSVQQRLFIAGIRVIFLSRLLGSRSRLVRFPENRQHTVDVNNEHAIVMLELDWNRLARIEQNFVVLADRLVFVVFDCLADRNDASGNDRNLVTVGKHDTAARLAFVLVFAHNDALADRLDDVIFQPTA